MKKAEKTRKRIENAFLKYTIEHNQRPNVSEICSELDIYRSTFYNYYSNIDELIEDVGEEFRAFIDEIFEGIDEYLVYIKRNNITFNFADVLSRWVPDLERNTDLIAVFFNPAWNFRYRDYMQQKVYNATTEILGARTIENKYITEFISAGTIQYIYSHIANGEHFEDEEFRNVWRRINYLVSEQ